MTAVSMLTCVGRAYYKLHEVIDEYKQSGVSKRIPSVPEGLVKGESKVFVAHPDAIVRTTTQGGSLMALAWELYNAGHIPEYEWVQFSEMPEPFWSGEDLNAEDFVPVEMLFITYALSLLSENDADLYNQLRSKYGLQYCMGVIGYSPFTGIQVVLDKQETDLPEELEHLRSLVNLGIVEPVHVDYPEEEDNADSHLG